jgi:hypothetical protein
MEKRVRAENTVNTINQITMNETTERQGDCCCVSPSSGLAISNLRTIGGDPLECPSLDPRMAWMQAELVAWALIDQERKTNGAQ